MTACPIFPECRRRQIRIAVALVIGLIALLLVAGCMEPAMKDKTTNTSPVIIIPSTTITTTDISVRITPAITFCPPQEKDPNSIISGEPFFFRSHNADTDASKIRVWIFGPKTAMIFGPQSDPDDKNNLTILGDATRDMKNGTYQVLIQYPHESGIFDVGLKNSKYPNWIFNKNGDLVLDIDNIRKGGLTGTDAANILENAINSAGSNQETERTTLYVTAAWIRIDPIGDHTIGDKFTISGTTNLAEGQEVAFDIMPVIDRRSEFAKEWAMTHNVANTQRVKSGTCGMNTWSFDTDSRSFSPEEYYVAVSAIRQSAHATIRFFMLSPSNPVTASPVNSSVNTMGSVP
jgi:trimeric autotransporter adhesin